MSGKIKKNLKRTSVCLLSAVLAVSGLGSFPDSDAAAKPSLASSVTVVEKGSEKLTIKAGAFSIKKVKAKSVGPKIAAVRVKKNVITIKGKKQGKTVINTTVNAVKNGVSKTFTYKTKVTVKADGGVIINSQKELEKALKDKKTKLITIGKKTAKINIPKGNYNKTDLIVNAPKASVVNEGTFKSIEIQAIAMNTWHERGKKNKITITSKAPVNIIVDQIAQIKSLIFKGSAQKQSTVAVAGNVGNIIVEASISVNIVAEGSANVSRFSIETSASVRIEAKGKSQIGTVEVSGKGADVGVNAGEESSIGTVEVRESASGEAGATEGHTKVEVKAEGKAKVDQVTTAAGNTEVVVVADGDSTVSNVKIEGRGSASVSGSSGNTTTVDIKDAAEGANVTVNTPSVKVETSEGTKPDSIVNNQSGQAISTETTKADGSVESGTIAPVGSAPTASASPAAPSSGTAPAPAASTAPTADPTAGGGGSGGSGSGSNTSVTSISLSESLFDDCIYLCRTGKFSVTAEITPAASTAKVTWSVSDPKVATVEVKKGDSRTAIVTGVGVGETTLTAKAGTKSISVPVKVLDFFDLFGYSRYKNKLVFDPDGEEDNYNEKNYDGWEITLVDIEDEDSTDLSEIWNSGTWTEIKFDEYDKFELHNDYKGNTISPTVMYNLYARRKGDTVIIKDGGYIPKLAEITAGKVKWKADKPISVKTTLTEDSDVTNYIDFSSVKFMCGNEELEPYSYGLDEDGWTFDSASNEPDRVMLWIDLKKKGAAGYIDYEYTTLFVELDVVLKDAPLSVIFDPNGKKINKINWYDGPTYYDHTNVVVKKYVNEDGTLAGNYLPIFVSDDGKYNTIGFSTEKNSIENRVFLGETKFTANTTVYAVWAPRGSGGDGYIQGLGKEVGFQEYGRIDERLETSIKVEINDEADSTSCEFIAVNRGSELSSNVNTSGLSENNNWFSLNVDSKENENYVEITRDSSGADIVPGNRYSVFVRVKENGNKSIVSNYVNVGKGIVLSKALQWDPLKTISISDLKYMKDLKDYFMLDGMTVKAGDTVVTNYSIKLLNTMIDYDPKKEGNKLWVLLEVQGCEPRKIEVTAAIQV